MMSRTTRLVCLALAAGMLCACGPKAAEPDPPPSAPADAVEGEAAAAELMAVDEFERRWSALLGLAVHPRTGMVDYNQLAAQRQELRALVAAVAPARQFAAPAGELAFRLNAYNLLVVAQVVDRRPRDTVRNAEGFFDRERFEVLGEKLTLDALRDLRVRPLGDARAHAAMCNAAVSAPALMARAFTADALDEQLTERAIVFVNDPTRNAAVNGTLMLSPVFRWFAPDFRAEPYGSALAFVKLHAEPGGAIEALLSDGASPPTEHLGYNWALNAK